MTLQIYEVLKYVNHHRERVILKLFAVKQMSRKKTEIVGKILKLFKRLDGQPVGCLWH